MIGDIQYVTLPEAAERLRVSMRTMYRWVRDGKIRVFQIGKINRISINDLNLFIQEHEHHGDIDEANIEPA